MSSKAIGPPLVALCSMALDDAPSPSESSCSDRLRTCQAAGNVEKEKNPHLIFNFLISWILYIIMRFLIKSSSQIQFPY